MRIQLWAEAVDKLSVDILLLTSAKKDGQKAGISFSAKKHQVII